MTKKKPLINNKEFQESIVIVREIKKPMAEVALRQARDLVGYVEEEYNAMDEKAQKRIDKKINKEVERLLPILLTPYLAENRKLEIQYNIHYDKIGRIFLKLANHLLNHHWFNGYDEQRKEEMRGEGLWTMTRAIDKYNYEKADNPHAYFSTITFNAYKICVKKNRKTDNVVVRLDMIDNYWSE